MKPFLAFATKFNKEKVHNILTNMFDLQYKGLQSISKFVGSTHVAKVLVAQYDKKNLLPLLVKVFHQLNTTILAKNFVVGDQSNKEVDEFCMFGGGASKEEATENFLLKELSLFCKLVIDAFELEGGPLTPIILWHFSSKNHSKLPILEH